MTIEAIRFILRWSENGFDTIEEAYAYQLFALGLVD